MTTIILLVLAVSLDALSFGLSSGFSKNKVSFFYALCMAVFSTILFAVPLYLSSILIKYLNSSVCYFINGAVLLLLGIIYLVEAFKKKNQHITNQPLSFKRCMLLVFPISLDAIITAFLSGYSLNYVVFGIIFYLVITFLFIYIPNIIALKVAKKCKINIGWLSGLIFILLSILKFLEI